ncbi:glycine--tRNA ligase [Candidatus Daviesbacteria bacterium]|nr:glycine--tRNA ligase [Candidatus Daviesbacteria bacterium]
MSDSNLLEKIVALCKRRGFIYPGSEIYGGLANTYDYGPMGAELLRNIRNLWWDYFVHKREDIVGLDASLISAAKIWEASGHTAGFADAMVDCKNCQARFRADHIISDFFLNFYRLSSKSKDASELISDMVGNNPLIIIPSDDKKGIETKLEGLPIEQLTKLISKEKILCPNCGKSDWTEVRKFNLLFPVNLGIVEGDQSLAYLRGETAQGIFINFKNIVDSTRVRLPFGVAQLGKSFRNEITLGNSIFRTIEFEQGEIEYFFDPEKEDWQKLFEDFKKGMWNFVVSSLGVKDSNLRWREHSDQERSFYSKKTLDLEYNFPFGYKELWGLAYRTDYDLSQHQKFSGKDLTILDPETNKKILPHVIEPAVGINRLMLMVLTDAYSEEGERIFLKLNPKIAPYKAAVFPLLANKEELVNLARKIYEDLRKEFLIAWDDRGNIGKRYASQDEIGTPYCITVDFDTLKDDSVTIRDRNSAKQERVKIPDLTNYLQEHLK